jgi:hypothetical protein
VRWFDSIDLTCERLGAGFWAEPLNAITALFFCAVALAVGFRARNEGGLSPSAKVLIGLGLVLGAASFLTHTLARQWTEYATNAAAAVLVVAALAVALVRFFGLSRAVVVYLVALFAVMSGLAAIFLPSEGLDGHAVLVPAVAVLLVFAGVLRLWGRHALAVLDQPKNRAIALAHGPVFRVAAEARREAGQRLLMAAVALTLALLLSSVDGEMCDSLPISLHFLSHVAAAGALYLVLDAVVLSGALARPGTAAIGPSPREGEHEGHEERGR